MYSRINVKIVCYILKKVSFQHLLNNHTVCIHMSGHGTGLPGAGSGGGAGDGTGVGAGADAGSRE